MFRLLVWEDVYSLSQHRKHNRTHHEHFLDFVKTTRNAQQNYQSLERNISLFCAFPAIRGAILWDQLASLGPRYGCLQLYVLFFVCFDGTHQHSFSLKSGLFNQNPDSRLDAKAATSQHEFREISLAICGAWPPLQYKQKRAKGWLCVSLRSAHDLGLCRRPMRYYRGGGITQIYRHKQNTI